MHPAGLLFGLAKSESELGAPIATGPRWSTLIHEPECATWGRGGAAGGRAHVGAVGMEGKLTATWMVGRPSSWRHNGEGELMATQRRGRSSSPWRGGEEDQALGGTAEWEDELIAA
jgi:hypothetical protein